MNNYADGAAAAYGKFEDFGEMPVGSILAKDSFTVDGLGVGRCGTVSRLFESIESDSETGKTYEAGQTGRN